MITVFEQYGVEYILDLNQLWKVYLDNFFELYDVKDVIRSKEKDIKTIGSLYRDDIRRMLMGKDVEFKRTYKKKSHSLVVNHRGIITDVWSRYMKNARLDTLLNWEYKVKLRKPSGHESVWTIIKRNPENKRIELKVYSKQKTELEEKLDFLSSVKKFNL